MAKVYIRSFGCQMNDYDSSRMADMLAKSDGMERSNKPDGAEVILVNTCSVREKAEEKLFDELGRLRRFKKANPRVRIGVGGCVASQEGTRILKRAPFVDIVFGPQTIHRLPEMLSKRAKTGKSQVDLSFTPIEKFDSLPSPGASGPKAFVSIMEGCSKYCTFCVVPYTRGREVSRAVEDVLDEVADLALQGVREVTLLGQNVNAYLGDLPGGGTASLAQLIECVSHIEGIERIRYTTSHPVNFTDDLIEAHGRIKKLMPSVHLPLQSGDDLILARMKRGHTLLEFKQIIRKLRKARPGISITSDFIVGFPGETEDQFQKTLDAVGWAKFDGGYSFIYSKRPGTPAASFGGQVPRDVAQKRLVKLQKALESLGRKRSDWYVGTKQRVLIEGNAKRGNGLCGRLPDNRTVTCKGKGKPGKICDVAITSSRGYTLMGELLP